MADEWAVKPLFFYRWWDEEDQAYVSRWAGEEWSTSEAATGSTEEIAEFRRRQISRMPILGATAENQPLLEESYRRILVAFEPHVGMTKYLFGSRPSLADFAWYGQLAQLATDPTPMRIMRKLAPMTDHWVRRLDDASGVDGAWASREESCPYLAPLCGERSTRAARRVRGMALTYTAHRIRGQRGVGPRHCSKSQARSTCRSSSPTPTPSRKAATSSRSRRGACLTC